VDGKKKRKGPEGRRRRRGGDLAGITVKVLLR
jgi:hypothetical protein